MHIPQHLRSGHSVADDSGTHSLGPVSHPPSTDTVNASPPAVGTHTSPRVVPANCEVFGDLAHAADPWVVLGGITAGSHVLATAEDPSPGWWQSQAAPHGILDPAKHPFLGMSWGKPGDETTNPTSTRAQAEALHHRLAAIGVHRRVTIVAASYGAMVAVQFAALYPQACARLILVGGGPNPHPFGAQWRRLQRAVVELGGGSPEALSLARQLALLSYRCPEDFSRRAARSDGAQSGGPVVGSGGVVAQRGCEVWDVQTWLETRGEEFAQRYDQQTFAGLSEAIDDHRIDPAQVKVPTVVIGIEPDLIAPADSLRDFVAKLPDGRYLQFDSQYGHDAFLKDSGPMARALRQGLADSQSAVAELVALQVPVVGASEQDGSSIAVDDTQTVKDNNVHKDETTGNDASAGAERKYSPETLAVHAGLNLDPSGAVTPPVHFTSTFRWNGIGDARDYDYSRTANPTRALFGDALAELESGAGATVTSSGMSACLVALSLCAADDEVLYPHDAYGGTWRMITRLAAQGKLRASAVDFSDPQCTSLIRQARPRMVWVETPSNPLLRITDLAAVAQACKEVGALMCVDNTLLSPGWQNPLEWGADLVVHSCTKYVAGHSDVISGAVVSRTDELAQECAWWANCLGVTGSPYDSWSAMRGLRTLPVRLAAHQRGTDAVVEALQQLPVVDKIHYPGLSDHPGHEIAAKQQKEFGAVVSFELHGGFEAARRFVDHLDVFTLAVSLGGVESLINHPATMTHAAMTEEAQQTAGITPGLLRFSIGIEAVEDVVEAVQRAARKCEVA